MTGRRDFLKSAAAASVAGAFGAWSFRARAALTAGRIKIGFVAGSGEGMAAEVMDDIRKQFTQLSPAADTVIEGNGPAAASETVSGFRIIRLPNPTAGEVVPYLDPTLPAIIVVGPALTNKLDIDDQIEAIGRDPQVVAVVRSGKVNKAGFIAGTKCLELVTASADKYPCGGRLIEVTVVAGGDVRIESRFVQTRLLHLVEENFQDYGKERLIPRLGSREDRTLLAFADTGSVARVTSVLNPDLAPWWGKDEVTLAHLTDTHICLDEYVPPDDHEYGLIGHFTEAGSRAILSDILDQVAAGRHRVEFFDETFAQDPDDERHYLELPIDNVLFTGDLNEHGRVKEADEFLSLLGRLPAGLRQKTMLVPGNHDLNKKDFAPEGAASSRDLFCAKHGEYLPTPGATDYVVHLTDWLTLIPLDSVIAAHSGLGMVQEKIDWLEDMLDQLSDRVVIAACHHPIYRLSLVPPAMRGYLRMRSHFTPKHSPFRVLLQGLFARHSNLKLALSGHYHGVVTDRFAKSAPGGSAPDDGSTTHIQTPCTIEYPCGYRLFKIRREGNNVTIDYYTAYTREAELREQSRNAPIFKILGTETRVPHGYEGTMEKIKAQESFFGEFARLDPYDLVDLNVRGFKDGSARAGKGRGGKANINGKIEISI